MEKHVNLDLVRIVAALMVLSVHIAQHCEYNLWKGAMGVQLFFVLSGYLAFASLEKNESALKYYKNRFVRIFPTYWFCLILVYLENLVIAIHRSELKETVMNGQCGWRFLRYVFCVQCFTPTKDWIHFNNLGALWTMSAFIGFYLLAPWLKRIMKNTWISCLITICMLVLTPKMIVKITEMFASYPEEAYINLFAESNPLTVLYCFLLGATLFVAIKEKKEFVLLLFIGVALIFTSDYYFELLFVVLLSLAVKCEPVFTNPKLCKIVKRGAMGSFSLYLIHPCLLGIESTITRFLHIQNQTLHAVFLYAFCIIISYLMYDLIISKIEVWAKNKGKQGPVFV